MVNKEMQNRMLGSLVGGAVGDALGYPVEFVYSYENIRAKYGEDGVRDYCPSYPWLGEQPAKALISDDTQMTLYTAEGLLYAVKNNLPFVPTICDAYLHWLGGQMGGESEGNYPSDLAKISQLNQRRAPGNTCISALMSIQAGDAPMNDSKGCGGIMRIAPIALYGAAHGWPLEKSARLAGEVAEITHLHQMSTLASACAAAIVQLCINGEENGFALIVEAALACVESLYPNSQYMASFKALVRNAVRLKHDPRPDWEIIENVLGGGWVAEEKLAIAVFSVARHNGSFADCVACAVNHGGDSDSTGAVAGNIIGAILGIDAIPENYKEGLQLYDLIVSYAETLAK